ncbi:MAG: DMT family transporter [Clostridia bacterium]|nr:DMT family transporter [Clostridia bacterium]
MVVLHAPADKKNISTVLMLLQFAIFGFSFVAMEKLIDCGCRSLLIIGVRFLLGAAVLALAGLFLPKHSVFAFRPDRISVLYGLGAGLMLFVAHGFQTYASEYTSAANNALFTGLNVVFVAVLTMILRRRPDLKVIVCTLMSIVGVALVAGFSFRGFTPNFGDGLAVLSGLSFGLNYMLLEKLLSRKGINLCVFTVFQMLVPSALGFAGSALFERGGYAQIDLGGALIWFLFMGVVASAATYLIQAFAQSHISATTISVLSCTEPVFAAVFSIMLGYDTFSLRLALGFVLIISATLIISLVPSKHRASDTVKS